MPYVRTRKGVVFLEPKEVPVPGDPDREWTNRGAIKKATRANKARNASGRKRLVDPVTTERDYSKAEVEFMNAMHAYKIDNVRPFPTWSEILGVLKGLGYRKP